MPSMIATMAEEMIAALAIRAGIDPLSDGPDRARTIQAANKASDRYGSRGATLREISMELLSVCGLPDPGNPRDRIQAAFSSTTGASIYQGLANTALTAPFRGSSDTTKGWVAEIEVADFKLNRRQRDQHSEPMEKLPRGQSAEHASADFTEPETYRVFRYAKQFVVDEQDALDADVDSIVQPALRIGRGGVRLKLDLIYSVLLANAALADGTELFHADHNNLLTGSALASGTIDSGMAAMQIQVENDAPLDLVPKFAIVPPTLRNTGRRLARDLQLTGEGNLVVRSEPRLELGVTDPDSGTVYAGSGSTWYLAAENSPCVEFGYRETNRPQMTSWKLKAGQWGQGFGVTWDIGVKGLDHRGLHKATA